MIKDPPFSKLDLISCRNLMIYLNGDLQKRLIPIFHYALNPGGFLFLGTSEGIGDADALFKVQDRKLKIYQRKERHFDTKRAEVLAFSQPTPALDSLRRPQAGKSAFPARIPMREMTEHALLQQVVAAAALVEAHGDILYLHGRSGMYLEPATGAVGTSNILKMAREGLRQELAVALRKAVETKDIIQVFGLSVKTNSHFTGVNLTVSDKYVAALLLPAVPALKTPASLLAPRDWFKPGRVVEIVQLDSRKIQLKMDMSIEKGSDYERISFSEISGL